MTCIALIAVIKPSIESDGEFEKLMDVIASDPKLNSDIARFDRIYFNARNDRYMMLWLILSNLHFPIESVQAGKASPALVKQECDQLAQRSPRRSESWTTQHALWNITGCGSLLPRVERT